MANHYNPPGGAHLANDVVQVATFISFTIYAASGSTVTLSSQTKSATYTMPASNILTITDLGDTVTVNAVFAIVGLVSTTVV